ncbi:hypothetical protein D3C76_1429670 [compost metagenome]
MPSGEKIPWLMALFRNRIFAGSTKIEVNGSRLLTTMICTPAASTLDIASTNGPIPIKARIANSIPMMPAEKLLTNISKPLLILPSTQRSKCLIAQPPNGPAIMEPRNIGMSAPTITPMVVMAPTTPPRSPPISLPPV